MGGDKHAGAEDLIQAVVQSKTLGEGCDGTSPKNLTLMDFIPNYALNNLANSISISLKNTEEEWKYIINEMHQTECPPALNPNGCPKLVAHKFHNQ